MSPAIINDIGIRLTVLAQSHYLSTVPRLVLNLVCNMCTSAKFKSIKLRKCILVSLFKRRAFPCQYFGSFVQ